MARAHYYVVLHEGQWKIELDGTRNGPYHNQADAIREAVMAAHTSGRHDHDAQVMVQGQNNQFRTEWTYGDDPYPAAG
jgi:hypothetical protein